MDEFEEKYVNISGGTIFKQTPTLDRNNTFSIQGVIYSGFTSEGVININELTRKDYGLDDKGFPISPRITNNNFFQKGAGWFEKSPKHRSIEVIDENNSSFVPSKSSKT
jgi:hypothetical protein